MAELVKEYRALNGGVNTGVTSELLKPNEVRAMINGDISEIGKITKTVGYLDTGNTVPETEPVTKIFVANNNTYAICNRKLYVKDGSDPLTDISDGNVFDDYIGGCTLFDKYFFSTDNDIMCLDPQDNTLTKLHLINAPVDGYDGISAMWVSTNKMYVAVNKKVYESSAPRQIVTTIIDTHIVGSTTIHVESTRYLQAGNVVDVYSVDGTLRQSITVTAVDSDTTFTCAATTVQIENGDELYYDGMKGTDTIMWDTDPAKGNWFYALGRVTAGIEQKGTALIFSNRGLQRYTGNRLDIIYDGVTNCGQHQVASSGDKVYFLLQTTPTKIMVVDNNDVYDISKKMYKYLVQSSTPDCIVFNSGKIIASVGDTNNSYLYDNATNIQIIYDTATDTFSVESMIKVYSYYVGQYGEFSVGGDNGYIYGKSDKPYIGFISSGNPYTYDNETETGLAIPFKISLKYEDFGRPDIIKYFNSVCFYTEPGTILNVQYSIDNGDLKELGQITKHSQSFEINDRGNTISFVLSESSKGEVPGFKGYKIQATYDEEE